MPFRATRPTADNAAVPRREGAAVLWKHWRLLEDRELYDLRTDPHQDKNVIDEHPRVVGRMRAHLDAWWEQVRSDAHAVQRVVIGSPEDNPTTLTACEWLDVFVDQQVQVRRGERKNGVWHLNVAQAGTYEFELRRWPRASELPLTAAAERTTVTDGVYPEGVALPIRAARIRAGGQEATATAGENDVAVTFQLQLDAGAIELQTWFHDARQEEICGAYYVYVQRMTVEGAD